MIVPVPSCAAVSGLTFWPMMAWKYCAGVCVWLLDGSDDQYAVGVKDTIEVGLSTSFIYTGFEKGQWHRVDLNKPASQCMCAHS